MKWVRNVRWTAILAVVLVVACLAVLFFLPAYSAFGIGLGLSAIVFGLFATRD